MVANCMDYIGNIVYRSLRRSLTFNKLYIGKKCTEITMTMRFNAGLHFCNIYCINGKTYNSLNTNNFPYQTYSIYVWTLFFRPVRFIFHLYIYTFYHFYHILPKSVTIWQYHFILNRKDIWKISEDNSFLVMK